MPKKVTILGLALLLVSGAASAQWISLFTDEERSSSSILYVPSGSIEEVYLFAHPSAEGVTCIELNSFTLGDGSIQSFAAVYNEDVAPPVMGTFPNSDLAGCFQTCHQDWAWFCRASLLYLSSGGEWCCIYVRALQGPPVQPYPKFLTCGGDEIQAYPFCEFCINAPSLCEVAVEESSWGAIKEMYK